MFNYTWLLFILAAVYDATVTAENDSNEPPKTPTPDASDTVESSDNSEDSSMSTGVKHETAEDQGSRGLGSKKKQAVKPERPVADNYDIFPIHERLRIAMFFLVNQDIRRMFDRLLNNHKRPVEIDDDLCRNADYDNMVTGVILSTGLVVGLLTFIHYFRVWCYDISIKERPKIQRQKVLIPQARVLNLRPKGL